MGLFKRGSAWYIDFYVNGRRVREKIGPNRKLAESVLAKRKVQATENRYLDIRKKNRCTFDQLAGQYMEWSKTNKKSWDRDERSILMLRRWFGGKSLTAINPLGIERFKTQRSKEVSPASVNRELACLNHMFSKANEWEMFEGNPVKRVKLFKEPKGRVKFLSLEQAATLVHECSDELRPIVVAALHTGMRRGEIFGLRWEDLDLDRRLIYVRDSNNSEGRELPITTPLYLMLLAMEKRSDFVFVRADGKPTLDIRGAYSGALKRAGIKDFTFHDLRHTFASHQSMIGVHLFGVPEW
jgi:integrase